MNNLFLKLLIVVSVICCVVAYSENEKRDVHRIILRSRRPRSHHQRGHKHSHHHYKKREKRGKYRHREPDYSFEDSSRYSDSRENSYENSEMYKPHYRRKPAKPRPYYASSEYEHEKYNPKEEWNPLFSSESVSHFRPEPFDSFSSKKKRKEKFKAPFRIELTTRVPLTTPYYSFFDNTEFPSYGNYKKTMNVKQLPLIGSSDSYKYKPNNTYEVHENHDDGDFYKNLHFQALAPVLAVANTELIAEASNNVKDMKTEQESFQRERKVTGRQRGRRMKVHN